MVLLPYLGVIFVVRGWWWVCARVFVGVCVRVGEEVLASGCQRLVGSGWRPTGWW